MEMHMKIYDISQEVFHCSVYPGDPSPKREALCSMEQGDLYNLTAFSMCAHNGTHIDAPAHFLQNGATVDQDRQTEVEGIFACGNVLHVHDLVDYVSEEAEIAGRAAAEYLSGKTEKNADVAIVTDGKIRYTVPQRISASKDVVVYFRVSDVFRDVRIVVKDGEKVLISKKKQKVAPGEMETVTVTADMLSKAEGNVLSFSLEQE